jgi:SAM-dependent methyltransferase
MSANFIFDDIDGELKFKGDFEGFYKSSIDPWGQTSQSEDKSMNLFYSKSRSNLLDKVKIILPTASKKDPLIEIGCGLGYVSNLIQTHLNIKVIGLDISKTAITKAQQNFPDNQFILHDISKETKSFANPSIVILSNLLWYILEDIDCISKNVINLFDPLNTNPYVIIQNAFFKENQKYGKSVCDGFEGAIKLFRTKFESQKLEIKNMQAFLNTDKKMKYDDGIIIFSLRKN